MTGTPPLAPGAPSTAAASKASPHTPGRPLAKGSPNRPLTKGSLSRQLVLRVTTLTALIAVLLSLFTAGAAFTILQSQLDTQLMAKVGTGINRDRVPRIIPSGADCATVGVDGPGGGAGQTIGQLQYWEVTDCGQVLNGTNKPQTLSRQAKTELSELTVDGNPTTVNVPDLGPYRLVATKIQTVDASTGVASVTTMVTGLPMSQIYVPIGRLLMAAAVLTLASIALAFYAAREVVIRSLRPLKRLASTANQVSRLELDSGEVDVPVRVPEADTDPASEVGQVGLAFNRMLDNVEGALASRQKSEVKVRQFVADASHELRNPLASIRGYAELTRRERDQVPENTSHALGRIESESERMSVLVEDLLLLARLDSGPSLALAPTHLNELVANAVSDAQVAGPDHDWGLSLPAGEVVAVGDPYRLHQVIANLLANARTHTPAGAQVETSLSSEGTFAVIKVRDNGPGIPAGIRDKVFQRFTRADASRARQGKGGSSTGLGLAIVSAVMQAHRGTASVTSGDWGTEFTLRVPLAISES